MYYVTDYLYLQNKSEDYNDDPFAVEFSFDDPKDANNYKNILMEKYKDLGGYLTIIYESKEPQKLKSLSEEEWSKIVWVKNWPGNLNKNRKFIKGYKFENVNYYAYLPRDNNFESYISITQDV